MASSRVKCTLSVEQCELLLKGHVASLDDQIYKNEDQEVVVKQYLQFLCACAQYTLRLNSKVVQQAAVSIFGIPPTGAKMFAEAMVQALQYCKIKGKCASSGKKLSDSVKSVVLSFRGADCLVAVQRALQGSSSMGSSSSSSTLRLPYLESQDKEEESPSAAPSTERGATDMVTAADIFKIYGMCPPPQKKKMLQDNDVHEIVSSQEVLASQESTSGRKQEEEHTPANKKPQQVALLANIYVACRGSVE